QIRVGNGATLRLLGGLYEIGTLRVAAHGRVEIAARVDLRIRDRLRVGSHSFVGPAIGKSLTAGDFWIRVAGVDHEGSDEELADDGDEAKEDQDDDPGMVRAVRFGPDTEVR